MAKKATGKVAPTTKDIRSAAIDAAFTLAEQLGWEHVTLEDIAQESGYARLDLYEYFTDKSDILAAYERRLTQRVLAGAQAQGNPRDALFDLLMDRFDLLNDDRSALLSILGAYKRDPKEALLALPYLGRSMALMLEAAGVETQGWRGALRIAGLSAVYLAGVKAWMEDESTDLAKTMAALDKNLARAEQWADRF